MQFDDATDRQVRASRPFSSSWVYANAGSGKTRVLTNRVARMLLHGVRPERILCLTYTKAAASEMQVRLFKTLGEWSMAPDEKLTSELQELGEDGPFSNRALRHARQMFATAIEAPGGLKIQTIHAFCASILRRFPLEAGISPAFRELDDRNSTRIRADILDQIAREAPDVLDQLPAVSFADLEGLCATITARSADISTPDRDAVWSSFGLAKGYCTADLNRQFPLSPDDITALDAFVQAEFTGPTDQKHARILKAQQPFSSQSDMGGLEAVFLTGKGAGTPFSAKTGKVPTKDGRALISPYVEQIDDLMARVEEARGKRLALSSAKRTLSFLVFASNFLERYEARKSSAGWLDFDDLISKTLSLLSDSSAAQWVLFRLDGGIDHILVDEAQDTSPIQWEVIECLAREFTTAGSARDNVQRTVFVVGDKKQSIYSFQGAAPEEFDQKRDVFSDRLGRVGEELQFLELSHSFRSSPAILEFVDTALGPVKDRGIGDHLNHLAFYSGMPGRVDLWPLVEPDKDKPEVVPVGAPVDRVAKNHPDIRLAAEIAEEISTILNSGACITVKGKRRRIVPGDFLILVQTRSGTLFREILRNLKSAGLAVAGADVLDLGHELAVQDLISLLKFLASPDDDLSLAEVIRSPILGLSEQDLFDIAHGRAKGQSVWKAFQQRRPADSDARRLLHDLLANTDTLGPFELLDRVLTRHGARQNLIGRLGAECEEGIDALLTLALDYESAQTTSLIGFLGWLDSDDSRIKRQADSQSSLIRVMTTHGAKGQESPIVILPDTRSRQDKVNPVLWDENGPLWKPLEIEMDARSTAAKEAKLQSDQEERLRLFYVAMTRAESWLILCGAGKAKESAWHSMASLAMDALGGVPIPHRSGKRYSNGHWPDPEGQIDGQEGPGEMGVPAWADERPAHKENRSEPLLPSDMGGAKALPGEGEDRVGAMDRGTAIHKLLEILPGTLLSAQEGLAREALGDRNDLPAILHEAQSVLNTPALGFIFAPDTLAEVPVSASLEDLGGQRIYGLIDRLVVKEEEILIVDFKSNSIVPQTPDQVPEGLLRQMGAYGAVISQIFPDHRVETAILWTRNRSLMTLSHDLVRAALINTPAP